MAFDIDTIFIKFQESARKWVGSKLAQRKDELGNDIAAVYKRIDPNPKGVYPFITVNVAGPLQQTNRSLLEYYDDADNLITGSNWDFLVTIAVFSNNKSTHTAQQIAFELSERLSTSEALCDFSDVGEVTWVYETITDNGKRDNEVFEIANFNVRFTVYSEIGNENTYLMNTVNADIGFRFEGADENEVETSISVQQPPPP